MIEILLAILLGPFLWLAGAIFFDGVHWVLHVMLRSRSRFFRTLAWPHQVHHEWIDRDLVTHWELRSANIWCHILLEYVTQLIFTGLLALLLPMPFVVVLAGLQTLVFLFILKDRGLDVNHRPVARLDAHPAGWPTPPSYHLLHHVWPDAYYSAYTKAVDWIVGGGAQIAGLRFACIGSESALSESLCSALEQSGGRIASEPESLDEVDVLMLVDPNASLATEVEAFIDETRNRQLPPEVWAFRSSAADAIARHYSTDRRVVFRALLVPAAGLAGMSAQAARRAASRALFWIRRDAHFVSLGESLGWGELRRFGSTEPVAPTGAPRVRHRLEYVMSARD